MWGRRPKPRGASLWRENGPKTSVQHRLCYVGHVDGVYTWAAPLTGMEIDELYAGTAVFKIDTLPGRTSIQLVHWSELA